MAVAKQTWTLDPQLASDTAAIGDLELARVLAMNDSHYPWLILVPRLSGAVEIIDLDERQQSQLWHEIALVASALKDVSRCDKLNIAAIGNVVPQLHVHVVARRRDDAAWPKPVWGAAPAKPYRGDALDAFITRIRTKLAFG
jgi:diadenosine tetraphosphate (Ap4A) HIT family hydrolase